MDLPEINPACPSCRQLLEIIKQQQKQINLLIEQNRVQGERIAALESQLEQTRREGKRQAAPFRKTLKSNPRKPGRKSGDDHGKHHRRSIPETINETFDVPLPKCCPGCQHPKLTPTQTLVQYQTEIPRTVIHRQFNIAAGTCDACGCHVQGRHELQTSDATGAAGVQLGPNVHAAISLMNKELGLSHGKVRRALEMLFDLKISRSSSCRSMLRTASRLLDCGKSIAKSVRGSPQVVADETGWRVEGGSRWLHVFVGSLATYYHIDPTRSGQPITDLLGKVYAGKLVHDGWSVYDALGHADHQQCLAHILRRIDALMESAKGTLCEDAVQLKAIFQRALATRDRFLASEITAHGCRIAAGKLSGNVVDFLLFRDRSDPAMNRILNFLDKHNQALFTFLKFPGEVDATNWRAEQAIRPAVVNRKVWGGNRTWSGAAAQSTLMSVIQTLKQRGLDAFHFLRRQLTSPKPLTLVHMGR